MIRVSLLFSTLFCFEFCIIFSKEKLQVDCFVLIFSKLFTEEVYVANDVYDIIRGMSTIVGEKTLKIFLSVVTV